ncbi:hypothetical protein N7513_001767 [Penicillium frequentans]|uniref:Developmental and secondary metabolism regulator veA n=1 Tax=Penicillium frequentans TaxID=3151616 RepID=A0AAD6D6E8_9EURO|nr:hypothetical protein N7494_000576 [Penicillium glabrum]KAJ5559368.1 hypothetical protein N7513_001767 [Penicillium glabrum]
MCRDAILHVTDLPSGRAPSDAKILYHYKTSSETAWTTEVKQTKMTCNLHAPHLSNSGCTTVQGGLITYQLRVIQQPEPFADHRFIDPPPVVQLRIVESLPYPSAGEHDVTFDNHAQFFLLVTIEPLHRQNTGHSSSVLIGDRFASIAHVRRPYPAGYFVLSDLAVRTAGQYYLKFSLFEKYISAGSDGRSFTSPYFFDNTRRKAEAQRSSQVLRFCLEVNSHPFIVFRPRSFPGVLNTLLSKVVEYA